MPTATPAAVPQPRSSRRRAAWRRAAGLGALLALPAAAACGQDGTLPAPGAAPNAPTANRAAAADPAGRANPSELIEPVVTLSRTRTKLEILKTFSKRVELPEGRRIAAASGWDENVVTVTATDSGALQFYAAAPGVSQVTITDDAGALYAVDVLVAADARALQAAVDRLFPGTAVEVYGLTDTSVVLRGWITRPEQVSQILDVAAQYFPPENILNQMRVAAPQQIQLNVRILEVQRSKAEQLGFNLSWFGDDGSFFASNPGQVAPPLQIGETGGLGLANGIVDSSIAVGVVDGAGDLFGAFVNALRDERLLKVMAEPVQVASNGRPSYFSAGGEIPIPVPQGGLGAVGIEYKTYGVQLTAVPIMLGGGRVRLEVAAEVSDLDFARGTTLQGTTVPGISQRQTNTQVELNFGETLMIAGLIQTNQQAAAQKVPILGELPGVGVLFRRVRYEDSETELVILVTPHPVAGLPAGAVPPCGPGLNTAKPTTRELFGLGVLEVPGGDECGPDCGPGCSSCGGCAADGPGYGAGFAPDGFAAGYEGAGYEGAGYGGAGYGYDAAAPYGGGMLAPAAPGVPAPPAVDPAAYGPAYAPQAQPAPPRPGFPPTGVPPADGAQAAASRAGAVTPVGYRVAAPAPTPTRAAARDLPGRPAPRR